MRAPLFLAALLPLAAQAQDGLEVSRPLPLSLKRAVEIATSPEGNAGVQLASEGVKQARSRSAQARAALLPGLDAYVSQQSATRNLAAMGIRFTAPVAGFQFPTLVGPFRVFDARAGLTQTIFDFGSIRKFQASRVGVQAAETEGASTRDRVAAEVARAYVAALRTEADLEAVRANIALAEAVLRLAQNRKAAGTGTGIEITRARVQLSNEKQRLLVAEDESRRARLHLLRAVGLRLDTPVALTGKLEFVPVDAVSLEQAKAEALRSRKDWQAQQERERNARLTSSAVAFERLPSVVGFADYGSIGAGLNNALPTRTFGISVRVPVFDGGRRDARRAEAASEYRQERIRTGDLKEQVELDLRLALDSLTSASQQVNVAEEGLGLAENELEQARRRYEAGVTDSLEVTDAQTRLERARDNRTAALFNYNLARIDLAQATGTIQRIVQ